MRIKKYSTFFLLIVFNFFLNFFKNVLFCISLKNRNVSNSLKAEQANPWIEHMDKYNIPKYHGSGVYVDLGGNATSNGKTYRYAIGRCPVYNKYISLGNGRSYLDRAPTVPSGPNALNMRNYGVVNDDDPPSGGFQMPESVQNVSPTKQETLYDCVKEAQKLKYFLNGPKNDNWDKNLLDQINCKEGNQDWICINQPFAYNSETKLCYLLYFNWQLRSGYRNCNNIPGGPTMYCFEPKKDNTSYNLVYGTSSIPEDYEQHCPKKLIKGGLFGKWSEGKCKNMKVVYKKEDISVEDCGKYLFSVSASDQPKTNGDKILLENAEAVYSHGAGNNWANYFGDKICEIYDEVPDCFILNMDGYALVSTASINSLDFDLLPCNHVSEQHSVSTECILNNPNVTCGSGRNKVRRCANGVWSEVIEQNCSIACGSMNPWYIAGPFLGIILAALIGGGFYYGRRKRLARERGFSANGYNTGRPSGAAFNEDVRFRKTPEEVLAETEASFWGEGDNEPTKVVVEADY